MLHSQKGITGIDIVLSMAVIVITVGTIVAIYTNIDLTSKSINRTASATRIATTMIEQINKKTYAEFVEEIGNELDTTDDTIIGKIEAIRAEIGTNAISNWSKPTADELILTIAGKETLEYKFFNVNIPRGYTVTLDIKNAGNGLVVFDLVREIDIKVEYDIGKNKHEVSLSTVRTRETVEECNPPLLSSVPRASDEIVIPIKYVVNKQAYYRAVETDTDWYSYSNKEWARVLVIKEEDLNSYIDSFNGRITKTIEEINSKLYLWIPRFYINGPDFAFLYSNTNREIELINLNNIKIGSEKLTIFSPGSSNISEMTEETIETDFGNEKGKWITYVSVKNGTSSIGNKLNTSDEYGPINEQLIINN